MTRFLIVDNATAVRMALSKHVLEVEHLADIKEATNAKEAIAMVTEWRPNLMFTGMGLADGEKALPM